MNSIHILLVDDEPSAVMITEIALQESWKKRGIDVQIHHCENGLKAIHYLQEVEILPHLVLTDVKMPLLDGLRLLTLIKSDDRLKKLPVVMISTSDSPQDISKAFNQQCAGYLLKSADFEEFSADLEALQRYWETSRLP